MTNNLVDQVVHLWSQGRTIEQIEEQLKVVIEVANEENLSESIMRGDFVVRNFLMG